MKDRSLSSFRAVASVFLIFMSGMVAVPNGPIPISIRMSIAMIGLIIGLAWLATDVKRQNSVS